VSAANARSPPDEKGGLLLAELVESFQEVVIGVRKYPRLSLKLLS
jgi:hypothetical protein